MLVSVREREGVSIFSCRNVIACVLCNSVIVLHVSILHMQNMYEFNQMCGTVRARLFPTPCKLADNVLVSFKASALCVSSYFTNMCS